MSDPGDYNPCACYLYFLRQSQEICSDTECYSPQSLPGPDNRTPTCPNDFLMMFIFFMIGMIFFMGPRLLRTVRCQVKHADTDSESDDEPPLPPPSVN